MGLFSSAKDKKSQQREQLFRRLKEAIPQGDVGSISYAIMNIRQARLLGDPEMPLLLNSAITTVSNKSLSEGLGMAIWALTSLSDETLVKSTIAKTFNLIARADRNNMRTMASVAMAANTIASTAENGSEDQKRAKREWLAAYDTLAAKSDGLQFAFAAASNAAVGFADMPLRSVAIDKWEQSVLKLAASSRYSAEREAHRVASGYDDFESGTTAFRNRAASVLGKLRNTKP